MRQPYLFLFLLYFVGVNAQVSIPPQVKLKGIITEPRTDPDASSVKKVVSGVAVTSFEAIAPETSDNAGKFTLVFNNYTVGDKINVRFSKPGYELFDEDLKNLVISGDYNHYYYPIKMCPIGTIARLTEERYNYHYQTLYRKLKIKEKELREAKLSEIDREIKMKKLLNEFQIQDEIVKNYAERFARIDFDDMSDLYKEAYFLYEQGKFDSVKKKLDKADLPNKAKIIIQNEKKIELQKKNVYNDEQKNKIAKKQTLELLLIEARASVRRDDLDNAEYSYDLIISLDTSNTKNLLEAWFIYYKQKHLDKAIEINKKIIEQSNDSLLISESYSNLGFIYESRGQNEKALLKYKRAVDILEEMNCSSDSKKVLLRNVYGSLGEIYYYSIKDKAQAIIYLEKHNEIAKELYLFSPKSKNFAINFISPELYPHVLEANIITYARSYTLLSYINYELGNIEKSNYLLYMSGSLYKEYSSLYALEYEKDWYNDYMVPLDIFYFQCEEYLDFGESKLYKSLWKEAKRYFLLAENSSNYYSKLSGSGYKDSYSIIRINEGLFECSENTKEKIGYLEKVIYYRQKENQPNSTDIYDIYNLIKNYENLSWEYLIDQQYVNAELSAQNAIELGRNQKIDYYMYDMVYIKLITALLFQKKYKEAEKVYLEMKKVYEPIPVNYETSFKKYFDELKKKGINHSNIKKIKKLLN